VLDEAPKSLPSLVLSNTRLELARCSNE